MVKTIGNWEKINFPFMIAIIVFLLPLWFTIPVGAASDPDTVTFDISEGNITVQPGTNSGTFKVVYGDTQATLDNMVPTQQITIISTSATTNTVSVNIGTADNKVVSLTLDDVNISSGACPFSIGTGSTVNLTLSGTNTLTSSGDNCPGLWVPDDAVLIITDASTGSLAVTAGTGAAGIGGNGGTDKRQYGGDGGTVTINGGTITATGGGGRGYSLGGAGIGGGGGADVNGGFKGGKGGTVTINGGTVTAIGLGGAGIGGGGGAHGYYNNSSGDGGTVIINGGTVTAKSSNGAGIGGGGEGGGTNMSYGGNGGSVTISGGTVIAESVYGAGIGGGRGGYGGHNGTVTINGGMVETRCAYHGAGIGGGSGNAIYGGNGGTVTINGGMVIASGGSARPNNGIGGGAGIGGGGSGTGYDGGNGGVVTINSGTVTATGGSGSYGYTIGSPGDGIGGSGGYYYGPDGTEVKHGGGGTVTINGGAVKTSSIGTNVYDSSGIQEYLVTISGLPASVGVSYTVNDGSSVSCDTDPDGRLYLWLPQGSQEIRITAEDVPYPYIASGESVANNNNLFKVFSYDALSKVCSQPIAISGGSGTIDSPYVAVAAINVPYSQATVATADLIPVSGATAVLCTDGSFSTTTGSISLTANAEAAINIRVQAQDGTAQLYYTVNITRAPSSDATLSRACSQSITISGGSGKIESQYLAALKVSNSLDSVAASDLTLAVGATADLFTDSNFSSPTSSISLNAEGPTTVYIRVTAMDGTSKHYYALTFTRVCNDILHTFDVSNGNITVQPGTNPGTLQVGYGASQLMDNIALMEQITIIGSSTTSNTISVNGSVTVNLTLNNVNISSSACPFSIGSSAAVHLTLSGTNTLAVSDWYHAGLSVPQGAFLNITSASTGSLAVTSSSYGAAIGGSGAGNSPGDYGAVSGTLIISGGTITANSNGYGAAIGGGGAYNGGDCGTVTINGGMVTAVADGLGSGIGGGGGTYSGNGGMVNITGGTVTAVAKAFGSGIGGGASNQFPAGNGGTVTISGGMVTAQSTYCGAGIGGGGNFWGNGGNGGAVTISGGTVIAAGGSDGGNGIGGAARSTSSGTITINGGSVNASSMGTIVQYRESNPAYLVTVTGLPQNYAVSYSVDGGNTVSCSTDASGKLYLWLPASGTATAIEFAGADSGTYSVSGTVQEAGSNIFNIVTDVDIVASAKALLTTASLNPVEGTDMDIIGKVRIIINGIYSGISVSIVSSAHTQIAEDGTITYGDSVVTGKVTFRLTKNTATDTVEIPITIPAYLTSLTIPDGVTSIGAWQFIFTHLNSVTIPASVTSIDSAAFNYSPLTRIAIGSNVNINNGANTMGTNQGFKTVYDNGGQQAGVYVYSGGTWAAESVDECFIATAAFGSKFEPSVALLRDFRDRYLLTNNWGTALVNFYYQKSPPIAATIASSEPLKIAVRVMLAPLIAMVYMIYHPILLVTVLGIIVAFLGYRLKRRKRYICN